MTPLWHIKIYQLCSIKVHSCSYVLVKNVFNLAKEILYCKYWVYVLYVHMRGLVSSLGVLVSFQLCNRTDGSCLNCLHTFCCWKRTSVNCFTSHSLRAPKSLIPEIAMKFTHHNSLVLRHQALPKTSSPHHSPLCCIYVISIPLTNQHIH